MPDVQALWWPESHIERAVSELARHVGLVPDAREIAACTDTVVEIERRIDRVAELLGLGTSVDELTFGRFAERMSASGPSLLHVPELGVIVIVGRRGPDLKLLARDGTEVRVRAPALFVHLAERRHPDAIAPIRALLDAAEVRDARRDLANEQMLLTRIGSSPIGMHWGLRLGGGAPLWQRLHRRGVVTIALLLVAAYFLQHGLFVASWGLIGLGALEGSIESAWLIAWGLLLVSQVPLRIAVAWLRGMMNIRVGSILKERFICGALRLRRHEIRSEGVGRLLGRVIESDALEHAALTALFEGVTAAVELTLALAVVLGSDAAWPNGLLLLGWGAGVIAYGVHYVRLNRAWTRARLDVTDQTVERMLGHETRVFQQSRHHWHDGEDEGLASYLSASKELDRVRVRYEAIAPRGWFAVGLLGSAFALVSQSSPSIAELAVILGGLLLAQRALATTAGAFITAAPAVAAWQQVRMVFDAGARRQGTAAADFAPGSLTAEPDEPVVRVQSLTFGHRAQAAPLLQQCDLAIAPDDRIVLRGRSGSGKSTLAGLLTGFDTPTAGTVMYRGVDRQTTGDRAWRWRVLGVCQFHDNHVFNASLAFNLLMGRRWPPRDQDWEDAKHTCRALGLGPLIDRMPAGLMQIVGQTGWQLSHGERSRLFVARALLQEPDVLVLDESLGALDPETSHRCLAQLDQRARALMIIAHP